MNIDDTIFNRGDDTTNTTAWNIFQGGTSTLMGKVLTIIDASYENPEKRDAVKDLVRDAFSNYRQPDNWGFLAKPKVEGYDMSLTTPGK